MDLLVHPKDFLITAEMPSSTHETTLLMGHGILSIFQAATINWSYLTSLSMACRAFPQCHFIFAPSADNHHIKMLFRVFHESNIAFPSLIIFHPSLFQLKNWKWPQLWVTSYASNRFGESFTRCWNILPSQANILPWASNNVYVSYLIHWPWKSRTLKLSVSQIKIFLID